MLFMPIEKINSDIAIAKRICEGLRSGEKECLGELVTTHNEFFLNFARHRLFIPDSFEDVVQSFWKEMLGGQTICAYAHGSENASTLRTYLVGVLNRRVIDANRLISRYEKTHQEEEHIQKMSDPAGTPHNGLTASESATLTCKLVHEALLKLSENSPTDASLVSMHLEGLNYPQMATRIGKRADAIRKQFTREPTGSLAKFKRTLENLMQAQGLAYEDI